MLCVISTMIRSCASLMAYICGTALSAPRSEVSPPLRRQCAIDGICGSFGTWNSVRKIGWSGGDRPDRKVLLRQHALDLLDPLPPRLFAPEVVDPEEAALEQVLAQPLHFLVAEPRGADVLHLDERALEQLVVGEPDDEVVRLAVAGAG